MGYLIFKIVLNKKNGDNDMISVLKSGFCVLKTQCYFILTYGIS